MTELPTSIQITDADVRFTGRANDLSRRLAKDGIAFVGLAKDRIDYAEGVTQELQDAGNAILAGWDWDAYPVPTQVTATQAKRALILSGLYEGVDLWITIAEQEPGGYVYRVVWDAMYWYRSSQELNEIADDMGLTETQVDDLFRLAATFE